ncbi:nuclear transport factor 2 family protein [Methanomicrobium antiquum]|uniref:Nuclear transport factor 2 family protein n=1 Tax=Methanomicrobium antiquum TaxID=487686 RepID=A0AAF0JMI0_9EURY|nr:nuclear transport factor 2 family protein [Methanomicrobium antiquum]WFN37899.1 nuclear transport factor 2 family protein [Methanomicrobium antiquum]
MSLTEAQKKEVRVAMEAYAAAYKTKDFDGMMNIFSPGICGFGSGPDEIIKNHESFARQIKRDMIQADVESVVFSETQINGEGKVAWVMTQSAIVFTVSGSEKQTVKGRSTMVLRNTDDKWLIEQIHFSMPYGRQAEGQSFPEA